MLWKHKKRGTVYTQVGTAALQTSGDKPLQDGEEMVVYRAPDGELWVRSKSEFMDGRFERFP